MPVTTTAPGKIWRVLYRNKFAKQEVVIIADGAELAQRVAEEWASRYKFTPDGPYRVIRIEPFCVADESILQSPGGTDGAKV